MEGLARNYPFWEARTAAGLVFTVGMVLFVANVLMTIRKGRALQAAPAAPATATAA
jgi:cytochrome c oxidase cbb3-type subunit 1